MFAAVGSIYSGRLNPVPYKDPAKQKAAQTAWYQANKSQVRRRSSQVREQIKEDIRKLKESTPCADCGNFFPYYVTDYDHLDGKLYPVSQAVNWYGREKVMAEIAKCDLVCSNCHRIRTHQRMTLTKPVMIGSSSVSKTERRGSKPRTGA